MILVVVAENGRRFRVECTKKRIISLNGKPCSFLHGSCRRVWRCGKYVIKLDGITGSHDSWDHDNQNEDEYETWKRVRPSDRKYFAKVFGMKKSGRGWSVLIQAYVKGRRDNTHIDKIEQLANRYGLTDIGPGINCVVKNGRPIIYDLGV
jgi:hypothetical protein